MCVCVFVCMCVLRTYIYIYIYIYIHICVCMCVYIYICVCVYTLKDYILLSALQVKAYTCTFFDAVRQLANSFSTQGRHVKHLTAIKNSLPAAVILSTSNVSFDKWQWESASRPIEVNCLKPIWWKVMGLTVIQCRFQMCILRVGSSFKTLSWTRADHADWSCANRKSIGSTFQQNWKGLRRWCVCLRSPTGTPWGKSMCLARNILQDPLANAFSSLTSMKCEGERLSQNYSRIPCPTLWNLKR